MKITRWLDRVVHAECIGRSIDEINPLFTPLFHNVSMCDCPVCPICPLPVETFSSDIYRSDAAGTSLLLGNGIIKAHPEGQGVTFSFREIQENLKEVYNDLSKNLLEVNCPEELMRLFRVELSYSILQWYHSQFKDFKPSPIEMKNL